MGETISERISPVAVKRSLLLPAQRERRKGLPPSAIPPHTEKLGLRCTLVHTEAGIVSQCQVVSGAYVGSWCTVLLWWAGGNVFSIPKELQYCTVPGRYSGLWIAGSDLAREYSHVVTRGYYQALASWTSSDIERTDQNWGFCFFGAPFDPHRPLQC